MSKLISMLGAPASGKSTLATSVHTELKKTGENSIFIPFSHGSRNCVGSPLATLEGPCIISKIISSVKFKTKKNPTITFSHTLRPEGFIIDIL